MQSRMRMNSRAPSAALCGDWIHSVDRVLSFLGQEQCREILKGIDAESKLDRAAQQDERADSNGSRIAAKSQYERSFLMGKTVEQAASKSFHSDSRPAAGACWVPVSSMAFKMKLSLTLG